MEREWNIRSSFIGCICYRIQHCLGSCKRSLQMRLKKPTIVALFLVLTHFLSEHVAIALYIAWFALVYYGYSYGRSTKIRLTISMNGRRCKKRVMAAVDRCTLLNTERFVKLVQKSNIDLETIANRTM